MKLKREITTAMSHGCRKAGCVRKGDHARGLCGACYRAAAKYVSDGVVTWEKLESQGKVEQPKATLKSWLLS